ncbi:TMhelix containing protein [Vibrio phage 1.111.B._10N.286.45.E6]|nr:TMhelix containing protein [Vibrio phage 1.111.A._10N.286.45.E6]AUR88309.1 TMhelix containing protein [Vibrio phage 1.111.B._10N.286.45.E6]
MAKKFFIFSIVFSALSMALISIVTVKDTKKTESAPIVKPELDPLFEIQKACRDNIYVIKASGIYEGIKNKQTSGYEVSEFGAGWFVKIEGVMINNGVDWVPGSMFCKLEGESLRSLCIAVHGEVLLSQ